MKKNIIFVLTFIMLFGINVFAETYKNIEILSIEITHGELTIQSDKAKTDTTIEVKEYPKDVIEIGQSGNILKITQKSKFDPLAFVNRVPQIIITVPENKLKEMSIKTSSAGACNIKNILAEKLTIESSANINISSSTADTINLSSKGGVITLSNSEVSNFTQIKSNSGDIFSTATLFKNMSEIESSTGSITININGKTTDYNYSLYSRFGKCYINGGEIKGNIKNNAPNALNIRTQTGKININFKE